MKEMMVAKYVVYETADNLAVHDLKIKQSTFPAGERYLKLESESVDLIFNTIKNCDEYPVHTVVITPLDASADTMMDMIFLQNAIVSVFFLLLDGFDL
jgi:hypothetical protein